MVKKEAVNEVNQEEFNKIIKDKKNKLVVCDFYAEWCMPCLMMSPIIESLAEKNKEIKFLKVNVDDNNELAQEFRISSIPCIVIIKNGKEVERILGATNENYLETKIKNHN